MHIGTAPAQFTAQGVEQIRIDIETNAKGKDSYSTVDWLIVERVADDALHVGFALGGQAVGHKQEIPRAVAHTRSLQLTKRFE